MPDSLDILANRAGLYTQHFFHAAEGFELLGRRLFGTEWTGFEYLEKPLPSPAQARAERKELDDLLLTARARIVGLQREIGREVRPDRLRQLEHELRCAYGTRNNVQDRIFELEQGDQPSPGRIRTAAQRRQHTERVLYDALRTGELQACLRGFTFIDRYIWRGEPGFRFDFARSEAVVPSSFSSQRRHALLFPVVEFRRWLAGVRPLRAAARTDQGVDEACRAYLLQEVQTGRKSRPKAGYLRDAQEKIPGLSKRRFDILWDQTVPESWRARGRPKTRIWIGRATH